MITRRPCRIRGQGQRPGIVSASEFDQRLDPGIDGRVGGKQVGKTLARVIEA